MICVFALRSFLKIEAIVILRISLAWLIMTSIAHAVDWRPDVQSAHHLRLTKQSSTWQLQSTGNDPFLVGTLSKPIDAGDQMLEFEYFSTTGVRDFSIVLGPPISEKNRIHLPAVTIAEGWQTYRVNLKELGGETFAAGRHQLRFDFGSKANRRIQIRNVRLRPLTQADRQRLADAKQKKAATEQQASLIRSQRTHPAPQWIRHVRVKPNEIVIAVDASLAGKKLILRQHPPYRSVVDPGEPVDFQAQRSGEQFNLIVSRNPGHDRTWDRSTCAWSIKRVDDDQASRRRYATVISPNESAVAKQRLVPQSQKGLTCLSRRGPRSDFVDLGIDAVTINLTLNQFLRDAPGPNRSRIEAPGPAIYFDPGPLSQYDRELDFARQHNMVVSAIVLIISPGERSKRSVLVHPDTNGGTYAMPDLTTKRGAAAYAFVLNQIAQRYRDHRSAPGAITNWIAHNEIDFHTVWTNMGQQPPEIVTETYYRSMRLINDIAKQHNPNARVFASLTHNWNVPDVNWQRLSPRALVEDLQAYSMQQGDFDWGVAYHPYPQSLFARIAWDDKRVTNDFDSPLITIKNLEVLGRFLNQPSMLQRDGRMRGVILSEQGFHSHSYNESDQDDQAASLWWATRRVRQMPWIESFHYHRWIDHPAEGGLMLGLRTLPTKQHPYGKPKRSWYVYRAVGTDGEAAATTGLDQPDTP